MISYPEKGAAVTWESQAMGYWKRKTGTVIGVIPAGFPVTGIPADALKSHIRFDGRKSSFDRALVAVPAGKSGKITHYYAPRIYVLSAVSDRIPEEHKDYLMSKFTKVE